MSKVTLKSVVPSVLIYPKSTDFLSSLVATDDDLGMFYSAIRSVL